MNAIEAKKICECGIDLNGTEIYCQRCGKHLIKEMRSRNEVQIELNKIKDLGADLMSLMLVVQTAMALEWVLGSKQTPSELIKIMADKEKERMVKK